MVVMTLKAQDVGVDTITAQNNNLRSTHHKTYEERLEHAQDRWMNLIPNLFIGQYAGNIGYFSSGIGWDYGKHKRWETHLLLGFIPKYVMDEDMLTFTIRENYIPWNIGCNGIISFTPLVASFSLNTVFNNEFWFTESERYPGDYYRFSSKLRAQIGIGSRINLHFTNYNRKMTDRLSFYYDLSSYDLAIISYVPNRSLKLKDILALGIGIQYKFF